MQKVWWDLSEWWGSCHLLWHSQQCLFSLSLLILFFQLLFRVLTQSAPLILSSPSSSFNCPFLLFFSGLLCLFPLSLPQCPEEKGGAFQEPGDHSPLSGSSPQSDREIRIRIAAHSPQCPSDELKGVRESEREGGEEWRGSRSHSVFLLAGGVPSVFTSLPSVMLSSLFYTFWRTYTPHKCMQA